MDLSVVKESMNKIISKIENYLDNIPEVSLADYKHQQDMVYISDMYNIIVHQYTVLIKLITEEQYFISQCNKLIRAISGNTSLEVQQRKQLKTAIEIVEEQVQPLYSEKERLKTIEMFYRNVYTRRDF